MNWSSRPPIAVIGAGIAGLAAAHFLKRNDIPVILFEAGSQVGGMAKSFTDSDGFRYDFGAHFITNRLASALGASAECRAVRYYGESVQLGGRCYSYPFGLMLIPRFLKSGISAHLRSPRKIRSADDWFRAEYGDELAGEVALPLLQAWSGVPADRLAASVSAKMQNSIFKVAWLKHCAKRKGLAVACGYSHEMPENSSVVHVYPLRGLSSLCDRLLPDLFGCLRLNSPMENIFVEDNQVTAVKINGSVHEVSAVVSTAPCQVLAKTVIGTETLKPLADFKFRPMVFVNMRFSKRGVLPDTVVWTPEKEFPFFRLTETVHSMPWLVPDGKTLVTADIGCEVGNEIWNSTEDALGERCVSAMEQFHPRLRQHYLGCHVLKTPMAYPVFLNAYEHTRARFERGSEVEGLYSIGRNGEFAHLLMEDVYWRTMKKMTALQTWWTGQQTRAVRERPKQVAMGSGAF